MIIEFLGTSGAGKTYLSIKLRDYLKKELKINNLIVMTKEEINEYNKKIYTSKIKRKIHKILQIYKLLIDKNFAVLLFKRRLYRKSKYNAKFKYILNVFIKYSELYEFNKNNKNKNVIFILDEGFLTSSIYMFGKNNCNLSDLENLTEIMNKIGSIKSIDYSEQKKLYIIVLCQDFNENTKRIIERGTGSFYSKLSFQQGKKFHENAIETFKLCEEEYLKRKEEDYVIIENTIKSNNYLEKFEKIKTMIRKEKSLFIS